MRKGAPQTPRACTPERCPHYTWRLPCTRRACGSASPATLYGGLVRPVALSVPRNRDAQRLRTAKCLRPRVCTWCLRPKPGTGLAPHWGGGLGATSRSWRGWTPVLPSFGCLRAMRFACLQQSDTLGILLWGRPSSLRSRAPALRASAGGWACARQPGLGRAAARLLRDVRLSGWRRQDSLLAPSKRVPASEPSRGGGLCPPLHDRRPGGRLALGDGLRPAGTSLVAPPALSQPAWGQVRLRGLRSTDALRPDLAPLRNADAPRRFAARCVRFCARGSPAAVPLHAAPRR